MTGAIASFTAMAVAGRAVRVELDTFELMFYRSVIGLMLVLVVAGARGSLGQIRTRRLGLHLIRNVSHFTGQNLWFYALPLIPLAQLQALEFTSPMWVTLLAPLVLGERLTRSRLLAAIVGFIGILVVARPDPTNIQPGTIAAAAAAIGFAGSILFTKRLTATESVTCIMFWLTAMQALMGLGMAAADGVMRVPSVALLPAVIVVGCTGLFAHVCLTRALSVAPAIVVVPMDFLRLPVFAVIGALYFHEPLDALVFAGAALILTSNLINIGAESRHSGHATKRI